MAGPGFFVPAFGEGFLPCGKMRRKKGQRGWIGKIAECSEAERSNFDLLALWRFRAKTKYDSKHSPFTEGYPGMR
jgi:hypothetical protein